MPFNPYFGIWTSANYPITMASCWQTFIILPDLSVGRMQLSLIIIIQRQKNPKKTVWRKDQIVLCHSDACGFDFCLGEMKMVDGF